MSADLDCARDLRTAMIHIDEERLNLAMALLSKWEKCNETHPTCRYRGDDCALQDLIKGFFEPP